MKKKFRYRATVSYWIEIEANSELEANDLITELAWDEWTEMDSEIEGPQEVKP